MQEKQKGVRAGQSVGAELSSAEQSHLDKRRVCHNRHMHELREKMSQQLHRNNDQNPKDTIKKLKTISHSLEKADHMTTFLLIEEKAKKDLTLREQFDFLKELDTHFSKYYEMSYFWEFLFQQGESILNFLMKFVSLQVHFHFSYEAVNSFFNFYFADVWGYKITQKLVKKYPDFFPSLVKLLEHEALFLRERVALFLGFLFELKEQESLRYQLLTTTNVLELLVNTLKTMYLEDHLFNILHGIKSMVQVFEESKFNQDTNQDILMSIPKEVARWLDKGNHKCLVETLKIITSLLQRDITKYTPQIIKSQILNPLFEKGFNSGDEVTTKLTITMICELTAHNTVPVIRHLVIELKLFTLIDNVLKQLEQQPESNPTLISQILQMVSHSIVNDKEVVQAFYSQVSKRAIQYISSTNEQVRKSAMLCMTEFLESGQQKHIIMFFQADGIEKVCCVLKDADGWELKSLLNLLNAFFNLCQYLSLQYQDRMLQRFKDCLGVEYLRKKQEAEPVDEEVQEFINHILTQLPIRFVPQVESQPEYEESQIDSYQVETQYEPMGEEIQVNQSEGDPQQQYQNGFNPGEQS